MLCPRLAQELLVKGESNSINALGLVIATLSLWPPNQFQTLQSCMFDASTGLAHEVNAFMKDFCRRVGTPNLFSMTCANDAPDKRHSCRPSMMLSAQNVIGAGASWCCRMICLIVKAQRQAHPCSETEVWCLWSFVPFCSVELRIDTG